jgi:hypothetical protein
MKLLEKRYTKIKSKLKKKKADELDRIGKEFSVNNYEKRFKVS